MSSTIVAAPSTLAAETGKVVAEEGGGPVDAMVAATLMAMCTEPGVCAPGGGGFVTIARPGTGAVTVDGAMAMPGLDLESERAIATRTVTMDYGGGVTTDVGPGSIAVPGGLAALDATHRRWGVMPWSQVIEVVAESLEDGFPLPRSCHYYLGFSHQDVFGHDPASFRALHDADGRLLEAGEVVRVDGLTASLRQIAAEGAETFYRGDLARRIVEDLSGRGSRLTRRDLATYRAHVGPALATRLGSWTVATVPPPAPGGAAVAAILRTLARGDVSDPRRWADIQHEVFVLRAEGYRSGTGRGSIARDLLDRFPASPRSGSTVSIAVAGDDGTVCASTMSGGYGSGVVPSGTGLWMNNSLGEQELNPSGPDRTPPGERLLSNMAPTVAIGPARRIAIGSPGAERITSALTITLALVLDGVPLAEAIEHPRCHAEVDRGTVAHEPGLDLRGASLDPRPFPSLDMYFGGVTAAEATPTGLVAHADSRRTGGVALAGRGSRSP